MPASRPSRTELRRAPAPIRSRHSPIPPGVKAGKRRAIGPGPKQLVGSSADPVAGSTLSALASNHHIDLPAAAAGTDQPLAPIEHGCFGAVPSGHLGWVRLRLVLRVLVAIGGRFWAGSL